MQATTMMTIERNDEEIEVEVTGWVEHGSVHDIESNEELSDAETDRAAECLYEVYDAMREEATCEDY